MAVALFGYPHRLMAAIALSAVFTLSAQGSPKVIHTIQGYTVTYPKGKIGGSSALGIPAPFVQIPPAKEYYLDYEVKFSEDFEWVEGGKLPGLVGGLHTSGCEDVVPGGWSARFMWHPGGAIDLYLYHQNRRSGCGDVYYPADKAKYPKNQWVRITQRVLLNTPGVNDGMVEVWYNGSKQLSVGKLQLRGKVSASTAMIDAVSLQSFYGGSSQSWAPPHDTHATFSQFYVLDGLPNFAVPFDNHDVGVRKELSRDRRESDRAGFLPGKGMGTFLFGSGNGGPEKASRYDARGRLHLSLER